MTNQNGNALFLILIAVALFAALSYAVTNSGRGGSGIDREQVQLGLSRIQQHGASVAAAIQRMRLIGGVPVSQLDFRTDSRLAKNGSIVDFENDLCTNDNCQVYHALGGGVAYQSFEEFSEAPDAWPAASIRPGHYNIELMEIEGLGSDLPELVIRYYGISADICEELHRQASFASNAGTFTGSTPAFMTGDPTAGLAGTDARSVTGDLAGQSIFCGYGSFSTRNLHDVILVR